MLPTDGNGTHYGTLLKLVNQAINFYPNHEITRKTPEQEPDHAVPEVSEILAEIVIGAVCGQRTGLS